MKHGLGGADFEQEMKRRLEDLGWEVSSTPITGDFGADLIGIMGREKIVVQCKDYGSPVRLPAIQEVYYARSHYDGTDAVVIARNGFTKAAIKAARQAHVHIFRPGDLTFGCSLDRTKQYRETLRKREDEARRQREENARQLEKERRERQKQADLASSELWREYDRELEIYNKTKLRVDITAKALKFFAILAILSLFRQEIRVYGIVGLLITVVVWRYFIRSPRAPERPFSNRRGATVIRQGCTQVMRVDFGRSGNIRCPRCNSLTDSFT